MNDQLTDVLERAAGTAPPPPPVLTLVRAGQRRRRRKVIAGSVTGVAGLALAVGLIGAWPTAQPQIDPLATEDRASPAPNIVQATGGAVPALPVDSEPIDVETRPLAGVGPDVREAAVASDGRVAISTTGSDLTVTHPDDAAPTPLSVPAAVDRCGSIAFDTAGDLWAFCDAGSDEEAIQATLLRYRPGTSEPTDHDVTELIQAASPTARYALLWIDDSDIRAVVPTDPPSEDGEPPAWRNASAVTLVADGELQAVDAAAIRELPSLELDTSSSVSASAGIRITKEAALGGRQLQIAWLNHEATAVIDTPIDDWDYRSLRPSSAFIGSTVAVTYELSSTDRTTVYGVVADGRGTTSVMRLPTTAQGRQDVRNMPSTPIVAMLLPAPDGSVHLLDIEESSLATAQVLPAAS